MKNKERKKEKKEKSENDASRDSHDNGAKVILFWRERWPRRLHSIHQNDPRDIVHIQQKSHNGNVRGVLII